MADCFPIISLSSICPALSATRSVSFRTLQQQYGDGYMARRQDGLNPVDIRWNLSTPLRPIAEVQELEAQLIANGAQAFTWKEPYASTAETWILDPVAWEWNIQTGELAQLTFSIKRFYT